MRVGFHLAERRRRVSAAQVDEHWPSAAFFPREHRTTENGSAARCRLPNAELIQTDLR